MPPKKSVKRVDEEDNVEVTGMPQVSNFEESPEEPVKRVSKVNQPTMHFTSSSKDSDRIQLIQAMNNFTLRGEQLIESMKGFDVFREQIAKLDIQINAKKAEHNEICVQLEQAFSNRKKGLENEYEEQLKMLNNRNLDANKKLELDYEDKNRKLQNEFKNAQIETKQKLAEFKLKACEELAKENAMTLIKTNDLTDLQQRVVKTNTDFENLKKSYDKDLEKVRSDERARYSSQLENDKKILQLNANVTNAEMKALTEQQVREIQVLKSQIENLKHELAEQRSLTKEVAQASAKSQITQTFGK